MRQRKVERIAEGTVNKIINKIFLVLKLSSGVKSVSNNLKAPEMISDLISAFQLTFIRDEVKKISQNFNSVFRSSLQKSLKSVNFSTLLQTKMRITSQIPHDIHLLLQNLSLVVDEFVNIDLFNNCQQDTKAELNDNRIEVSSNKANIHTLKLDYYEEKHHEVAEVLRELFYLTKDGDAGEKRPIHHKVSSEQTKQSKLSKI